jgi:hypothetical protein
MLGFRLCLRLFSAKIALFAVFPKFSISAFFSKENLNFRLFLENLQFRLDFRIFPRKIDFFPFSSNISLFAFSRKVPVSAPIFHLSPREPQISPFPRNKSQLSAFSPAQPRFPPLSDPTSVLLQVGELKGEAQAVKAMRATIESTFQVTLTAKAAQYAQNLQALQTEVVLARQAAADQQLATDRATTLAQAELESCKLKVQR